MMSKLFVPADFIIPEILETEKFRLRMLRASDVDKDYDAVMTSIDHLQRVFSHGSDWPSKNLTYEQDLADLVWHQHEFEIRSSFTYTVMNLDESVCLGCVYIFPSKDPGFEAEISMWVRDSEFKKGLDAVLFMAVKNWISEKWPFEHVQYPGRE